MQLKLKLLLAGALTSFALLTTPTHAQTQAQQLEVTNAFVREMPPVAPATGAFMQLKNTSNKTITLVKAHSDAAEIVELHTHIHENGVMRMREIPQITLEANQTVSLEPGGLHIMLIKPTRALTAGDKVEITLEMADGSTTHITAEVKKIMPGKTMQQHKHEHRHGHQH